MMTAMTQWYAVEDLFRESMRCRKCFDQHLAESAFIDVAQPRWIGPRYFEASVKILVILLNPGAGNTPEKRKLNVPFRQVLHGYKEGRKTLNDLFVFQRNYMPEWGKPCGQFEKFYKKGMGLDFDEVAFANIAWCADARNDYPREMLSHCFGAHTNKLIRLIGPDVVILSGLETHKYLSAIVGLVPTCRFVKTMHFAHRKGHDAERMELLRVRNELASASRR